MNAEVNGKPVIFYMLRSNEDEGTSISAVTKVTKAYLHGTLICMNASTVHKNFRIQKDLVSKYQLPKDKVKKKEILHLAKNFKISPNGSLL